MKEKPDTPSTPSSKTKNPFGFIVLILTILALTALFIVYFRWWHMTREEMSKERQSKNPTIEEVIQSTIDAKTK